MAKFKNNFVKEINKDRFGVLLVNLGTPKSPSTADVRRFLRQFLSDYRVIELPKLLWYLILNCVILVIRPKQSAHAYQSIWTEAGSPLLANSVRINRRLKQHLSTAGIKNATVDYAMRYGEPTIEKAIEEFEKLAINKIFVIPLYPQYSGSTTGSVMDEIGRVLSKRRIVPSLRFQNEYSDDLHYIRSLKRSVLNHWQENGQAQKLIFSFHGLPKEICERDGDPYYLQSVTTAELLAAELQLSDDRWVVCFQSRVGPKEWLQPYMDETLESLPNQGVKSVDVICPGFSVDCLETLEEVDIRYRELFLNAGGVKFNYIPCLNDQQEHIEMLAKFIQRAASDWVSMDSISS